MIECKDSCGDDSSRYRLKISEDEVFFGTILVGNASPAFEITLENVGWEDILFQSLSITGPFTLVRTNCPDVLKPGQKGRIAVTFTPTAFGPWTGAVFIMAGRAGDHNIRLVGAGYNSNENGDDLSGIPIFLTRENLEDNTNLVYANGTYALVISDEVLANNDFYQKTGDSGEGDWGEPLGKLSTIILNGQIDLKNLDDVIHGAADLANPGHPAGTVTLRNGETYRTLANILDLQITQEEIAIAQAGVATTQAEIATVQAGIATAKAGIATAQAGIAATIKNDILAISGVKGVAATKSEALAALAAGSYANGTLVRVKADETKSGASWDYQVSGAAFIDKGAAITNGPITVPRNVTPATSSSTTIFEVIPDEPLTNSAGGNDAVVSAMRQTTNYLTQGPTGHANYYNSVIGFGHNINGAFGPLNTAQVAASSRIEFKFAQGNPGSFFGAEYHPASLIPVGGGELRAITAFIAHDKTKWHVSPDGSSVGFAAYSHIWRDGRSAPRIQYEFSDTTAAIFYTKGDQPGSFAPQIYFEDNNRPFLYLINAARTGYVEPFRLTSGDRMLFSNPETRQISGSAGALGFGTVGSETQYLSPTAGTTGQVVIWQDVTGDWTPERWEGGISGRGVFLKRNTTSGGKFGQTWVSANGAMFISFEDESVGGNPGFQIRQTAGAGTLVFDNGWRGEAGAKTMLTLVRATGQAQFSYAPKLPSSVVGSLPAAATAGAGSIQYVTDLNATTAGSVAAGGGSNKGMVVCSGADWRIVAAW